MRKLWRRLCRWLRPKKKKKWEQYAKSFTEAWEQEEVAVELEKCRQQLPAAGPITEHLRGIPGRHRCSNQAINDEISCQLPPLLSLGPVTKRLKHTTDPELASWGMYFCKKCGAHTLHESRLCAACDTLNPASNPWPGPLITPSRSDNKVDFSWLGVDPRLPRECGLCGNPTTPSKIDDRMVACYGCTLVFMTEECHDDPNIQRDLTHCRAGISCKNRNDCEDNNEND